MNKNESKIAHFLENFSLETIPTPALHEAKRTVIDTLGCMIAGIDTPLGENLRRLAARFADPSGAKMLGLDKPITPFLAAMCNSYLANAHDADDGHRRSRLHAGAIIIPAALAVVEENGGSGREFMEAVLIGFELGYRAGMVTTGWETYHGSAMGTTFGVAAAAGRLLGLSPEQIINAMGIAEMQAPNCMLMGWVEARKVPMIKEGMGWSAASGIMSAYMAQSGITGTLAIFEEADEISEIHSLGKAFEIERHYFKPHPGCRWTHLPLQALKALMDKHQIHRRDIGEIKVRTVTHAANLDDRAPITMDNAQYSIPFVLAAALADGEFGPDQMQNEKLTDPTILSFAKRIKLEPEPRFDGTYPGVLQCEVQITDRHGKTVSIKGSKTRGDDNFPLSDEEIEEKFAWLSRNRLDHRSARDVIRQIWSLESQENLDDFMALIHNLTSFQKRNEK